MEKNRELQFPCSGCGSCCRRVGIIVRRLKDLKVGKDNPLYFPYKAKADDSCEMLGKDNKCMVYDNRPMICNIKLMTEHLGYDKKKYYNQNIRVCNRMMDEDNLPKEYRLKLIK